MNLKQLKFFKIVKNKTGSTLIEILIGLGIITISGVSMVALHANTTKQLNKVSVKSQKNIEFSNIIETIRMNIDYMQIHYDSSSVYLFSQMTKENMPWAIDLDKIVPASDCENCPGRLGYMIQPFTGVRGLYKVKLKIYHKELADQTVDYDFIVSSK